MFLSVPRFGQTDASACALSPFDGVLVLQSGDVGGHRGDADGEVIRDFVQRRRKAVLVDEVADEGDDFELFSCDSFHDTGRGLCV